MSADPPKLPLILMIDDETALLEIVQAALEGDGFRVRTAASPSEGLALYEKLWREIDLVLLDYLMPEMTGDRVFETLQRINPDVRVLLLTACEDRVAHKMFAAGLRGFLQKPFYLGDVTSRIREIIDAG